MKNLDFGLASNSTIATTSPRRMNRVNHHNRFRTGQQFTTYSIRIFPTDEQKQILLHWFKGYRKLYNTIIKEAYNPGENISNVYYNCQCNVLFNEVEFQKYWQAKLKEQRQNLDNVSPFPVVLLSSVIKRAAYDIHSSLSFKHHINRLLKIRQIGRQIRKVRKKYYSQKAKGVNKTKFKQKLNEQTKQLIQQLYKAARLHKPQPKARNDFNTTITIYGQHLKFVDGQCIKLPKIRKPIKYSGFIFPQPFDKIVSFTINRRIEYTNSGKEYFAWYIHITVKTPYLHYRSNKTNLVGKLNIEFSDGKCPVEKLCSYNDVLVLEYIDSPSIFCSCVSNNVRFDIPYPRYIQKTKLRIQELKQQNINNKKELQRLCIKLNRQTKSFINTIAKDLPELYHIFGVKTPYSPKSQIIRPNAIDKFWSYFIKKLAKACYRVEGFVVLVPEEYDDTDIMSTIERRLDRLIKYAERAVRTHEEYVVMKATTGYRSAKWHIDLKLLGSRDPVLSMSHPGNPTLKDKADEFVTPYTFIIDKYGFDRLNFLPILTYEAGRFTNREFVRNWRDCHLRVLSLHPALSNQDVAERTKNDRLVQYIKTRLERKRDRRRARRGDPFFDDVPTLGKWKHYVLLGATVLCNTLWKPVWKRSSYEEALLQAVTPAAVIRAKQWINGTTHSIPLYVIPKFKTMSEAKSRAYFYANSMGDYPSDIQKYCEQAGLEIEYWMLNIDKHTFMTYVAPSLSNSCNVIYDDSEFDLEHGHVKRDEEIYEEIIQELLDPKSSTRPLSLLYTRAQRTATYTKDCSVIGLFNNAYPQFRFEHPFETILYRIPWLGFWIDYNILARIGQLYYSLNCNNSYIDEFVTTLFDKEGAHEQELKEIEHWYKEVSKQLSLAETLLQSDDPIRASRRYVNKPKLQAEKNALIAKRKQKEWKPMFCLTQKDIDDYYNPIFSYINPPAYLKDKILKHEQKIAKTLHKQQKSYYYTIDKPDSVIDNIHVHHELVDFMKKIGCPKKSVFYHPFMQATNSNATVRELMMNGSRKIQIAKRPDHYVDIYCIDNRSYTFYSHNEIISTLLDKVIPPYLDQIIAKIKDQYPENKEVLNEFKKHYNKKIDLLPVKLHAKVYMMLNKLYYNSIYQLMSFVHKKRGVHTLFVYSLMRYVRWFDNIMFGPAFTNKKNFLDLFYTCVNDYEFNRILTVAVDEDLVQEFHIRMTTKFLKAFPMFGVYPSQVYDPVTHNIRKTYVIYDPVRNLRASLELQHPVSRFKHDLTPTFNSHRVSLNMVYIKSSCVDNIVPVSLYMNRNLSKIYFLGPLVADTKYPFEFEHRAFNDLLEETKRIISKQLDVCINWNTRLFDDASIISPYDDNGYAFSRDDRKSLYNQHLIFKVNENFKKYDSLRKLFYEKRDKFIISEKAEYPKTLKPFIYNPIPTHHLFAGMFTYDEIKSDPDLQEAYEKFKDTRVKFTTLSKRPLGKATYISAQELRQFLKRMDREDVYRDILDKYMRFPGIVKEESDNSTDTVAKHDSHMRIKHVAYRLVRDSNSEDAYFLRQVLPIPDDNLH